MIERTDRWLIERIAEPIAHFTEAAFGLSGFTLARFFVILLPVADATSFWQKGGPMRFGFLLISLFAALLRLWSVAKLEGLTGANPEKHLRVFPAVRVFYIGLVACIALLFYITEEAASLLNLIGYSGFLAHLYFCACDRPPPLGETSPFWRTSEV